MTNTTMATTDDSLSCANEENSSSCQSTTKTIRVADVGAGAGVSTAVLYHELGYRSIDAIDWSGDAWRNNVLQVPDSTMRFFELDDETFFSRFDNNNNNSLYTIIVYNFAINPAKAMRMAQKYLTPNGILLAPVNDTSDYWYKQSYWLLNQKGERLSPSLAEVGAWSVQFQPDVTSTTCTGIWCGGFNGYHTQQHSK